MTKRFLSCGLSFFMSLFGAANESHGDVPLIPRSILFGNPDKVGVQLSPNGEYISYIAPKEGVLNIFIAPSHDPAKGEAITNDTYRGIRTYFWAKDGEHVLYLQDNHGDENFRLYSYSLINKKVSLLSPERDVRTIVVGSTYKHPNKIIIGLNERDKRYFDLYEVDLKAGDKKLVFMNERFSSFEVDHDLNIRLASVNNVNGDDEYFIFKNDQWEPYITVPQEETINTGFLYFLPDNDTIYMLDSRGTNTGVLKTIELSTGKETILASNPKADVMPFTSHPLTYQIQAVEINYDKPTLDILDPSIKDDIDFLKTVDSGSLVITSRSKADDKWIVAFNNDHKPVSYYYYDRSIKKATYLFSNRKDLESYKLSPMHALILKARDGLELVSYLTLPSGVNLETQKKSGKSLPMVLYVHGGPWARDEFGLNPIHQWLSNRGYAVLSVNFRGSTGFGKDFTNSGNGQWGKKMHEDLLDAVDWCVSHNIADPKKVAIMGGSYGGYATLAGLTMTPEVFACGVDIVGPSSILTLINSAPAYWQPILNNFKKRIGPWDTEEQKQALLDVSPLTHAHNIKKPLLIGQGANDPRVKQTESDQIVEAMEKNNIPYLYALYKDEGHGFARPENKASFYAIVEQFLKNELNGRAEPIQQTDLKGTTLLLNNQSFNESEKLNAFITKSLT